MTVFISRVGNAIQVQARAEADGIVGDLTVLVRPGGSAMGRSYAEWSELKDGRHDV